MRNICTCGHVEEFDRSDYVYRVIKNRVTFFCSAECAGIDCDCAAYVEHGACQHTV